MLTLTCGLALVFLSSCEQDGGTTARPEAAAAVPPDAAASPSATPSAAPAPSPSPSPSLAPVSLAPGGASCAATLDGGGATPTAEILTPKPGEDGWDERYRGNPLDLGGTSLFYCEDFSQPMALNGPILWAKQHADVGLTTFDGPGGEAYRISDGVLSISAYQGADGKNHGGNIQSTSANQAYQGHQIVPGQLGLTCTGCYWEARIRFPRAQGTWGAFWLLTPDNPVNRGHLEVDGIEYYGLVDKRGHHHGVHRWRNGNSSGDLGDYTGMDAIADFEWHTYGIDLRGAATLDGKPALVIYFDGREVGRLAADADYFSSPFYYLLTLTLNPKDKQWTVPQAMEVDFVRVFRPAAAQGGSF